VLTVADDWIRGMFVDKGQQRLEEEEEGVYDV